MFLFFNFSLRTPFNWKTPFGYLATLLAETFALYSTVLMCAPFVCFLVGPCSLFIYFAKDITDDFRLLDADDKNDRSERTGKINEHFCNAVQLFADAKQLSWKVLLAAAMCLIYFCNSIDWSMDSITFINLLRPDS